MMLRSTLLMFTLLLGACENQVQSNIGGLTPISFSGYVLSGNVRNASVQAVGIDSNGQPNRNSSGEFYGDSYLTDEQGHYEALIQGAYAGSLLMVASYHESVDESGLVTKTQIRCSVIVGCKDSQAEAVAFKGWYDAPQDFEMWAVVTQVSNDSAVHITPLTHLAAKLSYAKFVSDGLACTSNSCDTTSYIDGVLTRQSIHSSNSILQQMFAQDAGFQVNIQPWSLFINESVDTAIAIEQAKHGLFVLAIEELAVSRDETLFQTLAWLTESLLSNQGQFFQDTHSLAPTLVSVKQLFDLAIQLVDQLTAQDLSSESLVAAKTALSTVVFNDTDNALTVFSGDDYAEGLDAKIVAVQALVTDVQGWLVDLTSQQYASFFDVGVAENIVEMDVQIEQFKATLAPQMQSLFLPLVSFVQHSLSCVRTATLENVAGECDDGDLKGVVNFNVQTAEFSYEQLSLPKISMRGKFAQTPGGSSLIWNFSFLGDTTVETADGLVTLSSLNQNLPSFKVTLQAPLSIATSVAIQDVSMDLPLLVIKAKDTSPSDYQSTYYRAEDVQLTMVGVKDALRDTLPAHYNIKSVSIPGQVIDGSSDFANKLEIGITINSRLAEQYYSPTIFPDLNFVLDLAAFNNYAQFGGVDYSTSELAGWLALPSDVVSGETHVGAVSYEEKSFNQLDGELQDLIGISETEQASAKYGALNYPGGVTALLIWKPALSAEESTRRCVKSAGEWACSAVVPVKYIGCGTAYEQLTSTVADAFTFLKSKGCIPQVTIDGRGIYTVDYPLDYVFDLTDGVADTYSITLSKPYYLGLETFNVRLLSRFFDTQGEAMPVGFLNILGSATDEENATIGISLTHGYIGYGSFESLGLLDLVPYGERTLWFTMGKQTSAEKDALVYYIQQGSVNMVMSAFDVPNDGRQPLGYFRYSGELIGTLYKEGDIYVIRYIDGSWQLL